MLDFWKSKSMKLMTSNGVTALALSVKPPELAEAETSLALVRQKQLAVHSELSGKLDLANPAFSRLGISDDTRHAAEVRAKELAEASRGLAAETEALAKKVASLQPANLTAVEGVVLGIRHDAAIEIVRLLEAIRTAAEILNDTGRALEAAGVSTKTFSVPPFLSGVQAIAQKIADETKRQGAVR